MIKNRITKMLLASVVSMSSLMSAAFATNMNHITINLPNNVQIPDDSRGIAISRLPEGSAIKGAAAAPKLNTEGEYFQLVDKRALMNGTLQLAVQDGFFGDISLNILSYSGDAPLTLSETSIGTFTTAIAPDTDHMLFAQSGSIQSNNSRFETGQVFVNETTDLGAYTDITFSQSYNDPVVIAYIGSRNGGDGVDVGVTNVTSTGARLFMQEPDRGSHYSEEITYIVAESGRYTLPDGTKVEARNHTTKKVHRGGQSFNGDKITFGQHYSNAPVVLHTVNSQNNAGFRTSSLYGLTKDGFILQQEAAEAENDNSYNTNLHVALRNYHGQYLVAKGNGGDTVNGNREAVGPWENFIINATTRLPNCIVNGDTVTIRTTSNYYWVADGGNLHSNRTSVGPREQFTLINRSHNSCLQPGDDIYFKSSDQDIDIPFVGIITIPGQYVIADPNGSVNVNSDNEGLWERFQVVGLSGQFGNAEETIGWIAIEAGREGEINGVKFKTDNVFFSANMGVDDAPATIDFTLPPIGKTFNSQVTLALTANNSNYFAIDGNGDAGLTAVSTSIGDAETFTMHAMTEVKDCIADGDEVTLKSSNGYYWSVRDQNNITSDRATISENETFTLTSHSGNACLQDSDKISLYSHGLNKYMNVQGVGTVHVWREDLVSWGAWSRFSVNAISGFERENFAFTQAPNVLVDGNTLNGADGYWVRGAGTTSATSTAVYAEEGTTWDIERSHAAEGLGYFAFEHNIMASASKRVPLDIIVNPLLFPITLNIHGVPGNAKLYRADGSEVSLVNGAFTTYFPEEAKGLSLDVSNVNNDFSMQVQLWGRFNETHYYTDKNIFINTRDIRTAQNGDNYLTFSGNRNDYSIERIANAFVVTRLNNTNEVTRVAMVDVDRLRFADGVVSAKQFYKNVSIATAISNQTITDNTFVIVKNIPIGALVNNAVALGNGAFAIAAKDIDLYTPEISIDFSTLAGEASIDVGVEIVTMTEADTAFLNGQGRLHGYANAKAMAEAGVDASASIGLDGVRAEARAYVEAGAVATAGGSVGVEGVGSISAEAEAKVSVTAEVSAELTMDENGGYVALGANAEASASVGAVVGIEVDFIPGTEYETGGEASVRMYAEVGAEGEVAVGDGKYGAAFEGGAEAGIMAEANGYGSASLGGVGAGGGGGVSAGLGAGVSGGGTAMYDNGEVTVGVSGEVAAIIGVEVDVEVSVDTGAVEDTAILIAEGYMTASDAVAAGFITAGEAINRGLMSVGDAIYDGFLTVNDAVNQGFMSADTAIRGGYTSVSNAVNSGLISAEDAAGTGLAAVADTAVDAVNAIGDIAGDIFDGLGF